MKRKHNVKGCSMWKPLIVHWNLLLYAIYQTQEDRETHTRCIEHMFPLRADRQVGPNSMRAILKIHSKAP